MLAKLFSKSFKLGISSTWTENFQMNKLSLNELEEPEIIWTIFDRGESKGVPKKTTKKKNKKTYCEKFLKKLEHQIIFFVSWETCVLVKVVTEAIVDSKLGEEYDKVVHCQFSLVIQSCPILWNPMDCGTSGLPVYHQLLEFTQTHVHWVIDAIQPSHPLSFLSLPTFNLSQHKGLFKC